MEDVQAPYVSSAQKVEEQWIDLNGHLNMAYYGVLFDRGADEPFERMGLGWDYLQQTNCSTFMLESHLAYVRELHPGDEVTVTVQLLDFDSKLLHYVQEMHHAHEGWLSATMEGICIHIDMETRKPTPFSDDVLKVIAAMHAAHKSLPVPPQVGQKIGIRRK